MKLTSAQEDALRDVLGYAMGECKRPNDDTREILERLYRKLKRRR